MDKKNSKFGLKLSSVIGLFLAIALIIGYINRQYIIDQAIVWAFKPTAGVVNLADRSGMNDGGKFLYLASQPQIQESQDFNLSCSRIEAVTSILGCYSNGQIYVYNVTDPQLDGVREVTAAHETLHAAYIRLSSADKSVLDNLLEAEYKKLISDVSFQQKMAFYDRTEPGQRNNELHSVIGTEVAVVSPELETYYDRYFSNRQAVVALNAKYITVFKSLESRANELKTQLDTISADISTRSAQYNADVVAMNSAIADFNYRADNSMFDSQYQFNQQRSSLVNRVNVLNNDKNEIDNQVVTYNALVIEYNSLATQSQKLYNSMDSTLAPAPSI